MNPFRNGRRQGRKGYVDRPGAEPQTVFPQKQARLEICDNADSKRCAMNVETADRSWMLRSWQSSGKRE